MKFSISLLLAGILLGLTNVASAYDGTNTTDKHVIVVPSNHGTGSSVHRELVSECIVSLPNADSLFPQITSEAVYLKEINGETGRNDWIKSYTATLDVIYLTIGKELLIITTRSFQAQQPIVKEVGQKLTRSQTFVSDPSQGGTYAGRSHRQYYFTKADDATKDVRERAKVWLQQQKPLLCEEKK